MNSKLHIGNLSPTVTEEDLRLLFSRAGAVSAVELKLDPATRQSRGSGFVTMATPELAAVALSDFHSHELGGRHITVTEARPPHEPKGIMSEGFNLATSGQFKPGAGNRHNRQRPGGGGSKGKGSAKHRPWRRSY